MPRKKKALLKKKRENALKVNETDREDWFIKPDGTNLHYEELTPIEQQECEDDWYYGPNGPAADLCVKDKDELFTLLQCTVHNLQRK
jgi:hypothetical protein